MRSSTWMILAAFRKEILLGFRSKAAWTGMVMFSLTSLASVGLSLKGVPLEPDILAALLWVVFFFAAIAGTERAYEDESFGGTLLTLRIYGNPQAIFLGKTLYNFFLLLGLAVFILPAYFALMGGTVADPLSLVITTVLGLFGIGSAGALLAALSVGAKVDGVFTILMLPVILPVFLPAISQTASAISGKGVDIWYLIGILLYDLILVLGAGVLFDHIWYEE